MTTPQSPARVEIDQALPKLENSPFESPMAQALQAAFIDGWGACRDAEFCGDDAMNDAFNQSATLGLCLSIDQSQRADILAKLAAERAEVVRLRKTLASLVGTPEDPNNGWRGNAKTSDEHFACEYCGSEHLDCTLIEHKWNCPVPGARAALFAKGVRE